jgi:hypothetical protein
VPYPHYFIGYIFGALKYDPSGYSFLIKLFDCRALKRRSVFMCPLGVFDRCSEDCFR